MELDFLVVFECKKALEYYKLVLHILFVT